jgi:hypothetical protein
MLEVDCRNDYALDDHFERRMLSTLDLGTKHLRIESCGVVPGTGLGFQIVESASGQVAEVLEKGLELAKKRV